MAKPSTELMIALAKTAENLENGEPYQWGHMGSCNCGHLAQVMTSFTKGEIHNFALQRSGDWSEQVEEYCPTSTYPMDILISILMDKGLTRKDLQNLERLSDPEIIDAMGRKPRRNSRKDVIDYLKTWAQIMESKLKDSTGMEKMFASDLETHTGLQVT